MNKKKNPLVLVLGISAFFFVVFLAVAVGTVMSLSPGKPQKSLFSKSNSIGVIEVKGVIMDSKKAVEQIQGFAEDPLVKGVIMRINSPGGAVAPSQEIYEELRKLAKTKPVYASMSSLAASGGYYIACGAKKIYANPGTITGSIGVIMQFADMSKLYQWAKFNPYAIKTGKYKDIGSPAREMSTEEKALLQDMIDNVLFQFRKAVSTARGMTMEKVIEVSDGRIFSGEQAKVVKLVDELGGFSDVVEAIGKEAGIEGKPNLVYAAKKKSALERILGDFDGDRGEDSRFGGRVVAAISALTAVFGGVGDVGAMLESVGSAASSRLTGPLFLAPRLSE